ncbi:MAG: 6-bladed beta-propeller [Tannerellaceae bacterium]|nr:6-bladed beta-propeller [Tannerellaceae bacterium]
MKVIPYILFVLFFVSCTSTAKKEITVPQILIDIKESGPLKLSDFFSDIQYIPLSDSILIGDIDRIKLYDDKLLLLTNKSVVSYDLYSGGLISHIRNIGNGLTEYISLYDMLFDKEENTIELLDKNGWKVLKYDINGRFINAFKIPFSSFSFYKKSGSYYWFYNNNMLSDSTEHKLIAYNPGEGKIIKQLLPIDKHLAEYFYVIDANNFSSSPAYSFYFCPSDTIYHISDSGELIPQYSISLGDNHTPLWFYKERYADIADFSKKAGERSYIYLVGNYVENNHMIGFSVYDRPNLYWSFYDKKSRTVYIADRLSDDYHFNDEILIEHNNGPFSVNEEQMCFILQPSQFADLIELSQSKNLSVSEDLLRIYNSPDFSEFSNPIIVLCKFKE